MPKYNNRGRKPSRTQIKGLRNSVGVLTLVRPRKFESIVARLEHLLVNYQKPADPEGVFLLQQVALVCLFRQTQSTLSRRVIPDSKLVNQRLKAIDEAEDRGRKLGFGSEDFFALNRWVTERDKEGKLEFLLNQTREKLGGARE